MSLDRTLLGTGEGFTKVAEAKIEAGEGLFEEPHPFLRTAVRGLASRLKDEFVPIELAMATELYVADMGTEVDGFTGEPMPADVIGMPPVMGAMVRIAANGIAREAFGDEFGDAVDQIYAEMREEQS